MYTKLAIQNMKKSIRNYVIYFVTITLTAAMMYSFLALGFSKEVLSMSENMSMLTSGILGMSVLVALIASFVISYAIRFMLEQRKKEFATYELLGMETSNIQKLFFIENGVIGMAAFFIGTFSGIGLSGVLVQIINHIFEMPHTYRISFSIKAFATAFILFMLMYGIGILRAAKVIRKRKIVDMLYDHQKNENGKKPFCKISYYADYSVNIMYPYWRLSVGKGNVCSNKYILCLDDWCCNFISNRNIRNVS